MESEFVPLRQAFSNAPLFPSTDNPRGQERDAPFVPVAQEPDPLPSVEPQPAEADPHTHAGTPEISVEKDGDRITHIRVRCSCGLVTRIECGY